MSKSIRTDIPLLITKRMFSIGGVGFDPSINYYHKLGINEKATDKEIKKAFYALAKKYHPDSNNHDAKEAAVNAEKFKDVSNAYEVLSDAAKRSQYDEMRQGSN